MCIMYGVLPLGAQTKSSGYDQEVPALHSDHFYYTARFDYIIIIPLVSVASFIEELGHLSRLSTASFTTNDHHRVLVNGFHYYLFFS